MQIKNGADLVHLCHREKLRLDQVMIAYERNKSGRTEEEIKEIMYRQLRVMRESVYQGLDPSRTIRGKIIGGEAKKLKKRAEMATPVCGHTLARAMSFALSVTEVNASMGRIVAAPTAGSCGVLPGVLFSMEETHHVSEEQMVQGLFTAGAIGSVIAKNASLSGAEGGCQAEIGSASAMAAAAAVEMAGGTVDQCLHGAAIALENLMGLICDPIAGLVEAPCSKRNAIGVANALISAEMALAGIESVVPFDEVVEAMHQVGRMMPCALRETAEGGLAGTPTGRRLQEQIMGGEKEK